MKTILCFSLCLFFACSTQTPSVKSELPTEMINQYASVETHVISRGKFQYVLKVDAGDHAGKYLPAKELPEAYRQDGMQVVVDATILSEQGIVYRPGATDIPEEDVKLPLLQVHKITKR